MKQKETYNLALRSPQNVLSAKQYAAFVKALDNRPAAGPKLKALMRRTPLWQKAR